MKGYERPSLIATFSIEELRADAASCTPYQYTSDVRVKTDIKTVDRPLDGLGAIHS